MNLSLWSASTDIFYTLAISRHSRTVENNFLRHHPTTSLIPNRPRDHIKPDHSGPFSSDTDRQTRPTSVSLTTRPNQCQSVRPIDHTRPPSISPPISLTFSQHAQPADRMLMSYFWYRSGPFLMGWVKGGWFIKLWMNLAKHTIHTRSAWSPWTSTFGFN